MTKIVMNKIIDVVQSTDKKQNLSSVIYKKY